MIVSGKDPLEERYFDYSASMREALTGLRDLIFEVAAETDGVNQLAGSLKWGQPTYEAVNPKTGSPFRIDAVKGSDSKYAMYFICTTSLMDGFRERYPSKFTFEGNRALVFTIGEPVPIEPLKHCIAMALTYRLAK